MSARIHSITFDRRERPKFAVVLTARGIVEVEWKCVAGDWCWFTERHRRREEARGAGHRAHRAVSRNEARCEAGRSMPALRANIGGRVGRLRPMRARL